jgi:hypothetical protein
MIEKKETHMVRNVELTTNQSPMLADDLVIYCEGGNLVVRGMGMSKVPWPNGVSLVLPNAREKLLSFFP